jgi:hypothetical protein
MATWIAHLRIAERLLNKGYNFEPTSFIVGNIGPDSGMPNEDWSEFNPPKTITHWQTEDNRVNAKCFYEKYIESDTTSKNQDEYSFKMGYYTHLLTDIEWSKLYDEKRKDRLYKEGLEKDKDFIWTIKKDWYGLDFLYLSKNPECIFHTAFKHINYVPDYLDYFPKGAFTKQVKYITEFYLGENEETKDNFIYLTEEEMERFINTALKEIENRLNCLEEN